MTGSGLLMGFCTLTIGSAWGFRVSPSGPLMGFWSVTVRSAEAVLETRSGPLIEVLECHGLVRWGVWECHGLVRSWGLEMSLSGPLMGFGSVTVWSALRGLGV